MSTDEQLAGARPRDAEPLHRPRVVLALLCVSQLMVILDGSIVAVALPSIGTDLHFSGPSLAWVVNAYLIPFGGLLLLAGRLGDVYGSRRILLTGIGVFTAASLCCALAQSRATLIAARALQGAGGALASAVVLGMIITLFRDPRERGRALAVFGFVGAAGSSVGLLAGGVLTAGLSWPWIFLINVPIGTVAFIGVRALVPAPVGARSRIDVAGAVLATGGVALGVSALLTTAASTRVVVGLGLTATVVLGGFVLRESRCRDALVPTRLLRSRWTGLGNLVQALMVAGLFGFQFLGVLYLQELLGYDALRAGLAFLPVPAVIAVVSLLITARLIALLGPRRVLSTGTGFVAVGLALLTLLPASDRYPTHLLPAGCLIGIGFGLAYPALAELAVASVPPPDAGVASGLFNTTQQVGGAIGLAVLTRVATGSAATSTPTLGGYHLAFAVATGLAGAAFALSLVAGPGPAHDPDVRQPSQLDPS